MLDDNLGCEKCNITPDKGMPRENHPWKYKRMLYDSSHESYCLEYCKHCSTPWLYNFKEFIDWSGGGNDNMYGIWMPLTEAEETKISKDCSQKSDHRITWILHEYLGRRRTLIKETDGNFYWSDPGFNPLYFIPAG
jgi:hypothetical protein